MDYAMLFGLLLLLVVGAGMRSLDALLTRRYHPAVLERRRPGRGACSMTMAQPAGMVDRRRVTDARPRRESGE